MTLVPVLAALTMSAGAPVPLAIASGGPGDLDAAFGSQGVARGDIKGSIAVNGLLRQSTGRLVLVGTIGSGADGTSAPFGFGLSRLNADGSADSAFGDGGHASRFFPQADYGFALAGAVQQDDSILVGGWVENRDGSDRADLVRFTPDGSLDTTFGTGGVAEVQLTPGGYIDAIVVQDDGSILVDGDLQSSTGAREWMLARFTSDGSPDSAFGVDGVVLTGQVSAGGFALGVSSDGLIYGSDGTDLLRFTSDGSLDSTFGVDGKVSVSFGSSNSTSHVYALSLQSDGAVVVGGGYSSQGIREFGLARYTSNGDLDTSFGSDGTVLTRVNGANDSVIWALATDPYGHVLATGQSDNDLATVRYGANGGLDPDFGDNGRSLVPYGGVTYPAAAVIAPNGRIVVATSANDILPSSTPLVARYNGSPPPTVPGAPGNVVADAGNGRASVRWDPPASDGGLPITRYMVTSTPDAESCTTDGGLTCTVTGLTNGRGYTFMVKAKNGVGHSDNSDPSATVTPMTVPGAPTAVRVTGGSSINVSWDAPSSDGGNAIAGYEAMTSPNGGSCTDDTQTSCTIDDLPDGTYRVTVVARNDAGAGDPSEASDAVLVDTTSPAIGDIEFTPAVNTTLNTTVPVTLSWTADDSGTGVGHSEVWLRTNTGPWRLVRRPINDQATVRVAADPSIANQFRVEASDVYGNGALRTPRPVHVSVVEQSNPDVTWHGQWHTVKSANASRGSDRLSSSLGASAVYSFTGSAIGIVAATGAALGSFKVVIDGTYVRTVSERSMPGLPRRIVYSQAWEMTGTHTLRLVRVGPPGQQPIDLDALIVLR